jgi:hypothetical protein
MCENCDAEFGQTVFHMVIGVDDKPNLMVHTRFVEDGLSEIFGGVTYGDRVAATGVFPVGKLVFDSMNHFNEWCEENPGDPRIETMMASHVKAHRSIEEAAAYNTFLAGVINGAEDRSRWEVSMDTYDFLAEMYDDVDDPIAHLASLVRGDEN